MTVCVCGGGGGGIARVRAGGGGGGRGFYNCSGLFNQSVKMVFVWRKTIRSKRLLEDRVP